MGDEVFLSYRRREAWFIARSIYQDLTAAGYEVFMDVEDIDSGRFRNVILNEIGRRPHFIVVLTPDSLRTSSSEEEDWLRIEIRRAIDLGRNVIPVIVQGFQFEASELTGVPELRNYNALELSPEFFGEAMERLRARFLKQPTRQELEYVTAEEAFQRGQEATKEDRLDDALQAYSEAVRLNPRMPEAFCNRAIIRYHLGDLQGALADLDQAILLDPTASQLYHNRGDVKQALGDLRGAIADYDLMHRGGDLNRRLEGDFDW